MQDLARPILTSPFLLLASGESQCLTADVLNPTHDSPFLKMKAIRMQDAAHPTDANGKGLEANAALLCVF